MAAPIDSHPNDLDPERALAERLRALDDGAWSQLFDDHRAKIWRYSLARTGSRDDADDVTSQVFLEALNSIHRYRYSGKPIIAWLYRIARNHASKLVRQRKRQDALPNADELPGAADAGLDALALSEALRCLTSIQGEVIALRFFAGYSTREIAKALHKSESAVYSLEVRAIGALRRQLGVEFEESSGRADKIWASRGMKE